ncbi:hypothetical protein [Streptomyces chrestomyceticus]|uniref:hypothetical protein n=1 Tax=Streptomyces chrestomyceticus TaxID=68185 RepID=UPI0034067057
MGHQDEWYYPFDGRLVPPYMSADRRRMAATPPKVPRLEHLRGLITYRRSPRNGDHK